MQNVPARVSNTQFLLNTKTDIDSVSKGKQGGSILTNSSSWSPVAFESPSTAETPNTTYLPELAAPDGPVYSTETDVQGTWQGISPTTADFDASQVNFGATQKSDPQGSREFRQKISIGLKKNAEETPAPLVFGVRRLSDPATYTQSNVSAQIGMTQRDAQGQELFTVDHTQRLLENGEHETETSGAYQVSTDLRVNGSFATAKDSKTSTLGFHYSHTEETAETPTDNAPAPSAPQPKPDSPTPKTLSISGLIQTGQTAETRKQSLTAGMTYGDSSLNYGRETIEPTQLTQGLALPQTQESLSARTKLGQDLTLGIEQKETVASFLDCDGSGNPVAGKNTTLTRGVNLDWQINEAMTLGFIHSRDILSSSSQPHVVNSTESNQVNLNYSFNPNLNGALSYTHKVNQTELYSAKLSYTDPASTDNAGAEFGPERPYSTVSQKWELGLDQENNQIDPQLNNRRYTLGYSTQRPDDGIALDCQYSRYIPQTGASKWDSSIRIYGEGTQAIPLVAEFKMSSEQNSPSFNLTGTWNF